MKKILCLVSAVLCFLSLSACNGEQPEAPDATEPEAEQRSNVVETDENGLIELINPKIIAHAGEQESEEGCLSVPGRWGITRRPMHVTVRALNRKGETFDISGSGLLAKAFCHEIDHLDGKLYTDCAIRMLDN